MKLYDTNIFIVEFDDHSNDNLEFSVFWQWMDDNFPQRVGNCVYYYVFNAISEGKKQCRIISFFDDEDAMAFKLRWL